MINAARIDSVFTFCHLMGTAEVEGPADVGGIRDSPKCDTVPEANISFKRVTSLLASFARLRRAGVISAGPGGGAGG